ncbi:hypothetical protein EDEG_00218 [Edhazardia aedis USNM 41457]|uniref:Uncharacterized protein n=1 Tax=Edhazardia aedis (strain USNM 41457) TaxID=1003232 RepID=J9D700_EDHAE|nr:hypothetical protein EDEG_00218 [Edhazardia aedis USNM 41457]|eukprot:EJW03309.1 hypothetical protein EDEG_00218 [Edhazardia aedis USNM 41457]
MVQKQLLKLVDILKLCKKQPIIFQRIYSHLMWVCSTEYKSITIDGVDKLSAIILHGVTKTKITDKNLEMYIFKVLNYAKRRKKINIDLQFQLSIIICYFLNIESKYHNNSISFDLFKCVFRGNTYLDGLIVNYINKGSLKSFFQLSEKGNILCTLEDELTKISHKSDLNDFCKLKILPNYIMHEIKPITLKKTHCELFILNILESFCFYSKFVKRSENIKIILPKQKDFINVLESFLNKNLKTCETPQKNLAAIDLYMPDFSVLSSIERFVGASVDKEKTKKYL